MIKADIYRNSNGDIYGFKVENHGLDIVCAAVSILTLNTVNSIEAFTDSDFKCEYEDEGGYILCTIPYIEEGGFDHDVALLFNCMLLGLKGIEQQYRKYIKVFDTGGAEND